MSISTRKFTTVSPVSCQTIASTTISTPNQQRKPAFMRWFFVLMMMVIGVQFSNAQVTHVVISQVYGGGGNSGATYQNDFVELFNPTGSSVNLSTWSVQQASAAGTSWTVIALTGSIAPGKYYLIKLASGGAVGAVLPTADVTNTTPNLGVASGKILLASTTTAFTTANPSGGTVIDLIGWGAAATGFEGSPAALHTNTSADIRANAGCTDANQNSTDFAVSTPTPRNSLSTANYCYPVQLAVTGISPTSPTAGVGFDVTVVAQNAGNNAMNVLANTAFTLSTNGTAGTIGGTVTGTINAASNTITVSGVTLSSSGSGATITATRTSGDNLTAGTSGAFTVQTGGGTPTKLVVTSVSPSSPTKGSPFTITVQSQDGSNLPQNVATNTTVNIAITTGTGTLSGTVTGVINSGANSVTFTGLTYSVAEAGVVITATDGTTSLTAGTTTFTVLQAASQLAFVGVPSTGTTGSNLTSFTVEARRPDNSVDNTYTGNIVVSKASGTGTLSGTTTKAAVAGIATFNDLQLNQGGAFTLNGSASGLSSATSGTITITALPAYWDFTSLAVTSGTPANLTISNFSEGNPNAAVTSPLNSTSASSGYTGASAGNNYGNATVNGAINPATSSYFEFTLTPSAGFGVTLTSISFGTRSTGSGAVSYSLRSSLNSYATDIATGSIVANSVWDIKSNSGLSVSSGPATPITFRIYGYGGAGASGGTINWRIDDVSLVLSVVAAPTITSFNPTSGTTGQVVNIVGTDFTGATAVSFGGTAASAFTVVDATHINATVASGTSGSVSVTTPGGSGSLAGFTYTLPPPSISSFTPASGYAGTSVTITGTNFTGSSAVTIGGTAVASFVVNSATQITAVVGVGTTGAIAVTNGTTATSASNFTFLGYISNQAGDWNTGATWLGGNVPPSGATVTIDHAVTLAAGLVNNGNVTVNSGKSFAVAAFYDNQGTTTINGTFQIDPGGFAGGANDFVYGANTTLIYAYIQAGTYGPVDNGHKYWPASNGPTNVTVAGSGGNLNIGVARTISGTFSTVKGIDGANNLTINGTLQINGGGYLTSAPTYGAASTLVYNTNYTTSNNEFPSTGVNNVTITAPSGTTTVTLNGTKTISGTLAIGNNTLNGGQNINAASITVNDGIFAAGTLTTSTSFVCSGAATISVSGDWNVTGFTKGLSTINFVGSGSINTTTAFYDMANFSGTRSITQNIDIEHVFFISGGQVGVTGGTGRTLTMSGAASQINISGGAVYGTDAGPGNDLTLLISGSQSTFNGDVNNDNNKFFNITVNSGSVFSVQTGILCRYGTFNVNGRLRVNFGGYIYTDPSGSVSPTYNASTGQLEYNTSYNQSAEWPALNGPKDVFISNNSQIYLDGGNRTITGQLSLGNGILRTDPFTITVASGGVINRTNGFITGILARGVNGPGTYGFPIASSNSDTYAPASFSFSSAGTGTITVATLDVTSNFPPTFNATKKLNRTWNITQTGLGAFNAAITFNYQATDLAGGALASDIKAYKFDAPSTYVYPATTTGTGELGSTSFTAVGITNFSEFGGGILSTYTLTYTAGANGSITGATPQTVNSGDNGTAVTAVPNTGYHFVNWSDASTQNPRTDLNVTADITVTANFAINTYTLTYDGNTNTTGTAPVSVTQNYNTTTTVSGAGTLTKTGYTFAGWNTIADGSGTAYAAASTFTFTANTTLFAQWTINSYTLTYDGNTNNGGTAPASVTQDYNTTTTVSGAGTLTKTGYTFTGWNTVADGSGTAYAAGSTFTFTADATLYAQWTINTYTVTYNGNGNDGGTTPSVVTANYNSVITVSAAGTLTLTGYTFAGWNTAADGSGTPYAAGGNFTIPAANTTLYAQWTINTYTLTYTAGANGTLTGTASQTVNYGADGTTVTAVANSGYHFVSWSDGFPTTARTDQNVQANITAIANFAIDAVNTFTLTYAAGPNGSVTGTSPQVVNQGADGSPVTAVPATCFHFVNWSDGSTDNPRTDLNVNTDISVTANFAINTYTITTSSTPGGSVSPVTGPVNCGSNATYAITADPCYSISNVLIDDVSVGAVSSYTFTNVTGIHSVTAFFTQNVYTITSSAGTGGTIDPPTQSYSCGTSATFAIAANSCYSIADIVVDGFSQGPLASYTFTNITTAHTISASFSLNTFTVTYTAGANGTISGTSPQTVGCGGSGAAVTAVADPNYHFVSWSDGVLTATRTDANVTANITVTATFAIDTHTLTYDGNTSDGGTAPASVTQNYNTTTIVSGAGTLTKAGYTFSGWNTVADGSGTAYAAGNTFAFTADATLFAQWTINSYTLTYDGNTNNGGTAPASVTQDYNTTVTVSGAGTLTKTGYTFTGWNTAANGSGTAYAAGNTFTFTADATLYAQWTINTYTVTYNGNGNDGGTAPSVVTANYNSVIAVSAAGSLTLTGYTFTGWNTAADGSGTAYAAGDNFTIPAANTILYAQWTINTYTLTYTADPNGSLTGTPVQTVNYGANGSAVTAVPNTGYHFVNWSDNSTQNPRTDVTVTADITVTANFAINTYTLTYTDDGNGIINGSATQTVNYGANGALVNAVPNTGFHFVNWSDNSTQNPRTDVNVTADITVTANFAINTYTLTYTAGSNGSITGTSPQVVSYGAGGTAVTAVADPGFHFVNWSDNSTQNPRTDVGVTADISVTANFAVDAATYTLTYTAGTNGSISGTSPQTVVQGGSGSPVTAAGDPGYHFVDWSDASTQNPRTDVNVTTNISVTANFAADCITPATPVVSVTPATCSSPTATITVTSPTGAGLAYSIDGTDYTNTSGVFAGLPVNTAYTVTVRNSPTCVSAGTAVNTGAIGGFSVHNTTQSTNYCTIQAAIDAANANDLITVDAGTYAEHVTVDKPLDIRGPNYGTSGTGVRVAEAVIVPEANFMPADPNTEVVYIQSDNVSFDGFSVNGDNPLINGASLEKGQGIYSEGNSVSIKNNIVQNGTTIGIFAGGGLVTPQYKDVVISNNKIQNFQDPAQIGYGYGMYVQGTTAQVTNNTVLNSRKGIQVQPYSVTQNVLAPVVSGNTFSVWNQGIFFNYATGGATAWTITGNTVTATTAPSAPTGTVTWIGIKAESIDASSNGAAISSNTVNGTGAVTDNITLSAVWGMVYRGTGSTSGQVAFTGNTVSNVEVALVHSAAADIVVTGNDLSASGKAISIMTDYNDAGVNLGTGGTNNINATGGNTINGIATGSATLLQLYTVEDAIQHKIDLVTLGYVSVIPNNDYVTTNSFAAPNTTASVQRGVDAATNGYTVNVAAGVYTNLVNVNKEVTINGAGSPATKVVPATNSGNTFTVAANNVTISNMQIEGVDGTSRGIYINSAVSNLQVTNVLSSIHQFALYADNAADITGLTILNSTFATSGTGIQIAEAGKVSGLTVTGGAISNNQYGLASNAQFQAASVNVDNQLGLTGVTVTGTSFTGNTIKGLYFEKLNNATFDNITVTGNGTANGGLHEAGIDFNMKFGTYNNIEVRNSTIANNGTNNPNGAGILVKARITGGGGNYATNPATLNNVSIHNNFITNNGGGTYGAGIRVGESNNSFTGTDAGPSNVNIHFNSFSGNTPHAIRNASNAAVNATCNAFGTTVPATVAGMVATGPGTLSYIPYLTSDVDTDVATGGFQTTENCAACTLTVSVDAGSPVNVTCNGASTGAINITVASGSGSYSYAWTGPGAFTSTSEDLTGLAAGAYSVQVTDLNSGCTATLSVTVTEPSAITASAAVTTPIACNGGTGTITITATGGTGAFSYTLDAVTNTTGIFTVSAGNNLAWSVTDANGCGPVTGTISITQPTLLVLTATPTQIQCFGGTGSVVLSATGGTGAYTYGPEATTNLVAGTYTFSVTDGNGCSATATATIDAAPAQLVLTATPTQPACFGQTGSVALSAAGGTGPYTITGDATTNLPPGTYNYSVTDAHGCIATASAVINAAPAQLAAPGITVVNNHDGTTSLTATGLAPGATVTWGPGGQTTNPLIVSAPGTFTVYQTAGTCVSPTSSATASPDIYADPAIAGIDITDLSGQSISANAVAFNQIVQIKIPVLNTNQDNYIPAGTTTFKVDLGTKFIVDPAVTLANSALNAYFDWTQSVVGGHVIISGNQIADIPGDFADSAIFQVQAANACLSTISVNFIVDNHVPGTVILVDEDVTNNAATLQYTIAVPQPTVTLVQPTCATATGSITVTAPLGADYLYSVDGVNYVSTTTFTVAANAVYNVTVKTVDGGCISPATPVTIDPQPVTPTIAVDTVINNTCHGGSTGSITVTTTLTIPTTTFTISPAVNTTGASTGIFTGLPAGVYTITVLSGSGCSASTQATVTEPTGILPDISLGSDYSGTSLFSVPGVEKTIVYNIAEVAGNPSYGDTLRVTKVAGYTLTFDNTAVTANTGSGPITLDNTRWVADNSNASYIAIYLNNAAPGFLNCQERVYISVKFKRVTPNVSTFSLSARLRKSNGEGNLTNNLNAIVFFAE